MMKITDEKAEDVNLSTIKVVKRDGRLVTFDDQKIYDALIKAEQKIHDQVTPLTHQKVQSIVADVNREIAERFTNNVKIYEIQNIVEHTLLSNNEYALAEEYIHYRTQRDFERSKATDINVSIGKLINKDQTVVNENANKDSDVFNTQRDLTAGIVGKSIGLKMLPSHVANAHQKGDIHYHDLDYHPYTPMTNCCLIDFKGMLNNGFKIGNADVKAREIIDDALKTAETKKKEALLEVKEESIKTKNELEKETKERRAELQRYEKRVLSKEESLDKRSAAIEQRETAFTAKETAMKQREAEVEELSQKRVQELERISGLTSEQAKDYLLKTVEEDVKHDTAKMVKELETRAKEEADKKAKEYVVTAIQRCAADHVAETTISVVQLPSDEMKGRIIGREGRNIRTLETLTGVELIIDDTPEAVVLSGFDPIRREVARIALERLIVDGRIHPARIEEMVEKAQKEVETMMREEGEAAALEVGVHGIHPELIRLLGRMKFRTSYGQNALKHSIEVAQLSGLLAGEIGLDVRIAKRAGLLHDIGKSIDHDVEGSHVQIGVDLCRKYKESSLIINAVEAHHGDVEPQSLIAGVVQAADAISAARPGARRETLETYTNRLKQLEDITNQFKGVEKSFAIQAGREIRVMVVPEQVSDDDMVLLARDISKQIEYELEYPGQIKVNVIRESRVMEYAK